MEKMTPTRMLLLAKYLRNSALSAFAEAAYWADALESHVAAVEFEEEVEIERIKKRMVTP